MSVWPPASSLLAGAPDEYPATLDLRRFDRGHSE